MIAASRAVEASTPVARRSSSVNCARAIAARTTKTTMIARRRRRRSLVLVDRETCETAGGMEANLPTAPAQALSTEEQFPYSNWGVLPAITGVVIALVAVGILAVPIQIIDNPSGDGEFSAP